MELELKSPRTVQVLDLVLEPYTYHDALLHLARHDDLDCDDADHLAAVLPRAIAQLDAVGDLYGALALDNVLDRLMRFQPVV